MDPLYNLLNMLYSKIALKQNLVIKQKSYLEIPVLNSEEKMGVTESKQIPGSGGVTLEEAMEMFCLDWVWAGVYLSKLIKVFTKNECS